MAFTVQFSPQARKHVKSFRKRDQQIILDAISEQLTHQADVSTRNRKKWEENELARWELRVGDVRVCYDVNEEEENVRVVAVGAKVSNSRRRGAAGGRQ